MIAIARWYEGWQIAWTTDASRWRVYAMVYPPFIVSAETTG